MLAQARPPITEQWFCVKLSHKMTTGVKLIRISSAAGCICSKQRAVAAAKRPSYLEIVSQTFVIVQDFVSRVRLAADPVDILIAPDVTNIGWIDFHRAAEAIEVTNYNHGC